MHAPHAHMLDHVTVKVVVTWKTLGLKVRMKKSDSKLMAKYYIIKRYAYFILIIH